MFDDKHHAGLRRSTSIIMRDGVGLNGARQVSDEACALSVHAFPTVDIDKVVASGVINTVGAYALTDKENGTHLAYVGESGNVARRLQEHAADPSKSWATEVFVISGLDKRLEKAAAVHFQKRLTEVIETAGSAELIKGVNPCSADLPAWRVASLDRMFAGVLPLLFDAGCRCIAPPLTKNPAAPSPGSLAEEAPPLIPEAREPADGDADDDEGPMEIGVALAPIGVVEQSLAYGELWARGYEYDGRFLVVAGSEMRRTATRSANEHTQQRRRRLIEAKAARLINEADDCYRLEVAVAFPSMAIAAKVLCGAHVASDKWRPLPAERPYMIAR